MIFSKGFILPSPSHPVALRIEERTKGATTKVVKLEKNCTPLLSPLSSLLSTLYSLSFFPDSSDRDSALVQSKRDGRQSRKGGSRVRSLLRPFDPLI